MVEEIDVDVSIYEKFFRSLIDDVDAGQIYKRLLLRLSVEDLDNFYIKLAIEDLNILTTALLINVFAIEAKGINDREFQNKLRYMI